MRNRLIGIAAVVAGAGTTVSVLAVGEGPVATAKFWANPAGGAFTLGPWVLFDGFSVEPTDAPGEADVAVFDIDQWQVPREGGAALGFEFQSTYGVTINAPVFVAGMRVGDVVTLLPNPALISLGSGGLRIGTGAELGGTLFSPGTIFSSGEVVVGGGSFSEVSGHPRLVMPSTSRLFADAGVSILPVGEVDAAGMIEGDVYNAGLLDLFRGSASSLLIRGGYTQARAGGGGPPFGGVLRAEIVGPSENNDLLVVQGHAALGGTLLVDIISGYQPLPGQLDATILSATSLEGRFDLVFFSPSIDTDLRMRVVYPDIAPPAGRNTTAVRVVAELAPPQPQIGDGTEGATNVPAAPVRAATGDFNGDGFVDVVAAVPSNPLRGGVIVEPGQVLVVMNKGINPDGSWRGFDEPVSIDAGFDPADVAVGDVDDDGDLDIAVISKGTPLPPPDATNGGGGGGPGGPDPVAPALRVLLNDGSAGFADSGEIADVGFDPRGLAFGNFIQDPDGLLDLVVTSLTAPGGDGQIVILTNSTPDARGGRAWNGWANTQSAPAGTGDPGQVAPGGLDNPKDIDDIAIGVSAGGSTVSVHTNTNSLNARGSVFNPPIEVPVGDGPRNISLADIDSDGDTDIITSNQGDGTVSIVLNRPNLLRGGIEFVAQSLPLGDNAGSIAAFDFDNDSDTDIAGVFEQLVTAGNSRFIRILRNDSAIEEPGDRGTGGSPLIFSQGPVIDFGANSFYVLPGDVDNDGDLDVIAFTDPDGAPSRQATAFVNALCPTDLDGSGKTDTVDLCKFLYLFGQTVERGGRGDLIRDGVVDTRDLVRFLARFGQVCR